MIRFALVVAGLLAFGAAGHAQPADVPAAPGAGREPSLPLGEVARTSGPHRAALRSTRAGGAARQFDWTAIAVGTPAGTARGVAVALAGLDGSGHSLLLDADEVEPLLAYLEGAPPPPDGAAAGVALAVGYFQLRGGSSLVGFRRPRDPGPVRRLRRPGDGRGRSRRGGADRGRRADREVPRRVARGACGASGPSSRLMADRRPPGACTRERRPAAPGPGRGRRRWPARSRRSATDPGR